MNDLSTKEVIYQQCLYEEITGNKPTKEKCGFHCSEETCEYCIETTIQNDLTKQNGTLRNKGGDVK